MELPVDTDAKVGLVTFGDSETVRNGNLHFECYHQKELPVCDGFCEESSHEAFTRYICQNEIGYFGGS